MNNESVCTTLVPYNGRGGGGIRYFVVGPGTLIKGVKSLQHAEGASNVHHSSTDYFI